MFWDSPFLRPQTQRVVKKPFQYLEAVFPWFCISWFLEAKKTPSKQLYSISNFSDQLYVSLFIPGTQMTLVLNGKGLLLEGSNPKIEDKQVPGIFRGSFFTWKHATFYEAFGTAMSSLDWDWPSCRWGFHTRISERSTVLGCPRTLVNG